jgi:hypothetical protein
VSAVVCEWGPDECARQWDGATAGSGPPEGGRGKESEQEEGVRGARLNTVDVC